MTITLAQIDELFASLNDDEQLLLIDHLADRTPYSETLLDGLQVAAKDCAEFHNFDTDSIIPWAFPDLKAWKRHADKRDATLEGAIRLRALGRAAA